jgi:hypothetical protein
MTLPYERTRSVVRTRAFLTRLVSPYLPDGLKRIPKPVREEALRLLRHYPSVVDLKYAKDSFCPEEADRIMGELE